MAADPLARSRFRGLAFSLAESLGLGSFVEDVENKVLDELFERFTAAGGKAPEKWLATNLPGVFVSASALPRWGKHKPEWPFLAGAPMVFIGQIEIPTTGVAREKLSPGTTVFVFGARSQRQDGWEMVYRSIDKVPGLP